MLILLLMYANGCSLTVFYQKVTILGLLDFVGFRSFIARCQLWVASGLRYGYEEMTFGLLDSMVFAIQYRKYGLVSADLGQQTLSGLAYIKGDLLQIMRTQIFDPLPAQNLAGWPHSNNIE